jgi:hypothetical protein
LAPILAAIAFCWGSMSDKLSDNVSRINYIVNLGLRVQSKTGLELSGKVGMTNRHFDLSAILKL